MRQSDADEPKTFDDPQASRFERLLTRQPNNPAMHYNLGTVRYRRGRYDQAAESLSTAIASSSASLQGRASYNLGNTHYRLGRAAEGATPDQAIEFYQQALEDYRLAIRQDPKDRDAKYNYELVDRRLQALKTRQANAQAAQSGQAQQEQAQQAQAQQQDEPSGESQQQQAASMESEPPPESSPSTETAQDAEQQQPEEHAQATQQQPSQQGSEQQALWILDALKREERGALEKAPPGPARESDVEQDW